MTPTTNTQSTAVQTLKQTIQTTLATTLLATTLFAGTAAASHGSLSCSPPAELTPLFDFLHSLGELAFIGGVALATVGFLVAAVFIVVPGEEYTRRGKDVAKHVLLGTVLLLSANMIVAWIVASFGGGLCP